MGDVIAVAAYAAMVVPVVVTREALELGALVLDHVTGERWGLRARIPWWARNPRRGLEREREWERFKAAMRQEQSHE